MLSNWVEILIGYCIALIVISGCLVAFNHISKKEEAHGMDQVAVLVTIDHAPVPQVIEKQP